MPRDLTALEARALLAAADLRGLRKRARIKSATMAEALNVPLARFYNWERRDCYPRDWGHLAGYARIIIGLAAHEQVTWDDREPWVIRHADHGPGLVCRPALGNGLCEPLLGNLVRYEDAIRQHAAGKEARNAA